MNLSKLILIAVTVTAARAAGDSCSAASRGAPEQRIVAITATCLACHGNGSAKIGLATVPRIAKQQGRYLLNAMLEYRRGIRSSSVMRVQLEALMLKDLRELAAYFADEHPNEDVAAVRALGAGSSADTPTIPPQVGELCGSCHGETGGGNLPEIPSLAGQYADYLNQALRDYRSGARHDATMGRLTRQLSGPQMKRLADYFSTQTARPFSLQNQVPAAPAGGHADTGPILNLVTAPDASKTSAQVIRELAMIDVPAGTFAMGDDDTEGFSVGYPRHLVHIRAFRIGATEVTFEQFDAFSTDTHRPPLTDEGWGRGTRPVINVTWAETQEFIVWLNRKSGRHFRLPSESEWEYAARGGTTTVYWWGNEFNAENLNARGTNQRDKWMYTAPVGEFPANPLGLYDTSGNVAERVADCWHSRYIGAPLDGSAWQGTPCYSRVSRGGSWNLAKRPMRSSARAGTSDYIRSMALGFRLAEDPRP